PILRALVRGRANGFGRRHRPGRHRLSGRLCRCRAEISTPPRNAIRCRAGVRLGTHARRSPARRVGAPALQPAPSVKLLVAALLSSLGGRLQQPWMIGPFTKPARANPVIAPNPASRFRSPLSDTAVAWEAYATFNPAAVVKDGKVYLLYRAEDASGEQQIGGHTSRLGLAESNDGVHFTRRATPVLCPDTDAQRQNEWPGGVEDPRIATSGKLLDWTPVEGPDGRAVKVLSPRAGFFDSWLVEGGPPALLTARGVLVLYNAGSLPSRTYSAGQALFDARDPTKPIARSDSAFIKPTESYERTGQYTAGTTFVEGLVRFRGRWYLYYGTADSRVGVAVWDPQGPTRVR